MNRTVEIFALVTLALTIGITLNAQWIQQRSGTNAALTDVVMLDTATAIAVGRDRSILRTTNAGTTWLNVAAPLSYVERWNGVSFFDTANGIAVGDHGVVVTTTNSGRNWLWHGIPRGQKCLSALHVGPNNVYVGADSGWIYHSLDSGRTWSSEKISAWPIRSLFAWRGAYVMGLPIYALTPYSLCSKVEFPPSPWKEMVLPNFQGLGSEAFSGEFCNGGGAGFIVGVQGDLRAAPAIVRKSMSDTAWRTVPTGIRRDGTLLGVSAPSPNVIYVCGIGGMIFKSTNGGDTWTAATVPTTPNLNAVYFCNEKRGFAVGDSGTILFTANGGTPLFDTPPPPFHLLRPTNGDTMTVMRSITFVWQKAIDPDGDSVRYTLLISSDRGTTWVVHGPTTDTMLQVHSPARAPGPYFWTVIATDGELATPSLDVFKFTISSLDYVQEENVPNMFTVYQNYPNPFNSSTTISFRLPFKSFVTLKVFDALAREAATLISEELPAGLHAVRWGPTGLPSGIYFYRLQMDSFVETKKLVLLR